MSLNKNENWLKEDVDISEGDYQQEIVIKGANTNNLQNIDLSIPKNQLVVITGVSGSGKSSLINNTLYKGGGLTLGSASSTARSKPLWCSKSVRRSLISWALLDLSLKSQ